MGFKIFFKKHQFKILTFIYLGSLIFFFEKWGAKGFFYWMLIFVVFFCIRLYMAREYVFLAIKQVETVIYGKPLEKGLWKKNEFKNTKFRPSFMKRFYEKKEVKK